MTNNELQESESQEDPAQKCLVDSKRRQAFGTVCGFACVEYIPTFSLSFIYMYPTCTNPAHNSTRSNSPHPDIPSQQTDPAKFFPKAQKRSSYRYAHFEKPILVSIRLPLRLPHLFQILNQSPRTDLMGERHYNTFPHQAFINPLRLIPSPSCSWRAGSGWRRCRSRRRRGRRRGQ